jgi:hypothetical protein
MRLLLHILKRSFALDNWKKPSAEEELWLSPHLGKIDRETKCGSNYGQVIEYGLQSKDCSS